MKDSRDRGVAADIWERNERQAEHIGTKKILALCKELEPVSAKLQSRAVQDRNEQRALTEKVLQQRHEARLSDAAKMSAKRQRMLDLASEALPAEKLGGTGAEQWFVEACGKRGAKAFRSGWPDYLVILEGKTIGVEVKRGADRVSERQTKMFAAIEAAGIPVFVWNPAQPKLLTPWRRYVLRGVRTG